MNGFIADKSNFVEIEPLRKFWKKSHCSTLASESYEFTNSFPFGEKQPKMFM